MRTKLLVFAAAIALSFTFMGCKGGNTPEDPSKEGVESNYKSPKIVSVTKPEEEKALDALLEDGTKMHFRMDDYGELSIAYVWNKEVIQGEANEYVRVYDKSSCVIPDYVTYGDRKYPVTQTYIQFMQDGNKFLYGELYGNLTTITLPPTITLLRSCCNSLPHLTDIYCYAVEPPHFSYGEVFFNEVEFTLHVPSGSIEKYTASQWSEYAASIVAITD